MHTSKLLEKMDRQIERLFSQYHNLSDTKSRAKVFQQIADIMTESIKIEHTILSPAAHRKGLEPLMKEIVGEHLSVKRVIADLLDMIHGKDGYDAKTNARPEPGNQQGEEAAPDVSPTSAARTPPEEHAVIGENIAKLFARLKLQDPRFTGPAQTYQAARWLH